MPVYNPSEGGSATTTPVGDPVSTKTLEAEDFTGGIYYVQPEDGVLVVTAPEPDYNIYIEPDEAFNNKRLTVLYRPSGGEANQILHVRAFPLKPASLSDAYVYWGVAPEGKVSLYANKPATGVQWVGTLDNPVVPEPAEPAPSPLLKYQAYSAELDGVTNSIGMGRAVEVDASFGEPTLTIMPVLFFGNIMAPGRSVIRKSDSSANPVNVVLHSSGQGAETIILSQQGDSVDASILLDEVSGDYCWFIA